MIIIKMDILQEPKSKFCKPLVCRHAVHIRPISWLISGIRKEQSGTWQENQAKTMYSYLAA